MSLPYNPHAIVELGGERHDSWRDPGVIVGVEVELATGETSRAEVKFFDPDPEYRFLNRLTGEEGIVEAETRVWLGFGTAQELGEPIFKGTLARASRDFGTTTLRCYDASFRMRKKQRAEYHYKMNDLEIIKKLALRNELKFEGPTVALKLDRHNSLKQEGETDWALARSCAERAGLVLYVRGDTLFAKEAAKTGAPVLTLAFREDFMLLDDFRLEFHVPENQEGRPARVETRGRGRGGRRLNGEAERHQRGSELLDIKRDLHVKTRGHAAQRALARKALQREHAFTGSVSVLPAFKGRRAEARDTVELRGLPKLFNGAYIVDGATHVFALGELQMELDIYRDIKA